MKNRITTLDEVFFDNSKRMIGNSTRQIDSAIEHLFNGWIVMVRDHVDNGKCERCNRDLFNRIIMRLKYEHNLDSLIRSKKININTHDLELELL